MVIVRHQKTKDKNSRRFVNTAWVNPSTPRPEARISLRVNHEGAVRPALKSCP